MTAIRNPHTMNTNIGAHNATRNSGSHMARRVTIALAASAAMALSSCSAVADRVTEKVVEEGVERVIEADSGENVDVDFDYSDFTDGDGGFSIETDDGSFSIDNDGNVVLETEDGTFTGGASDDGYAINGDDGTVFEADFNDEDGSFSIETEEGSISSGTGDDSWDAWPSAVERPALGDDATVFDLTADGEVWISASGLVDGDPMSVVDAYIDSLDGFTIEGNLSGVDGYTYLSNDDYFVVIYAEENPAGSGSMMTITLASAQ